MGVRIIKFFKPFMNLSVVLLLLAIQFVPLGVFWNNTATAAPVCVNDTAGANDEPGQKDLTKLCVDYAGLPSTVQTTWNWDDLGTNGANTMDACSLFDTDGDGNINYSVCVTTLDTPATLQTLTTYSCGDDKIDRCTSPASVISSGTTSCAVSQQNTDPFPTGADYPTDTQGSCTVQLSTVGGSSAKLIDVCSYPSAQPNSDPSDCVIIRDSAGKVELIKDLIPGTDSGLFNLSIDGPGANDTTTVNNVGDGGTTGEVVVKDGSVVVKETPGTSTLLTNYSTTIVCRDLNGTGAIVAQSSPTGTTSRQLTFTLDDQADVVCVITNTRSNGTITLIKNVVNDNGGSAGVNDFGLSIEGTPVTSGQTLTLAPGQYSINEAGLSGYQFVSITGTGCPAQLGGNVTLASNQNITCTITNDDLPGQLRVIKNVVNDNGGDATASDFTLYVNGEAKTQNQYFVANAGSYTVTEDSEPGYSMTGIECVNDNTQQSVTHPVSLGLNQSVTCTVTNDDKEPALTIVKHVVNNNGGNATADDFILKLNGNSLTSPVLSNANTTATYAPNVMSNTSYTVSEDELTGYEGSSVTCVDNNTQAPVNHPVTLNEGQSVTCTITNNDIAPKITVIKTVINNNGGTLEVEDFPLFVGDIQVTSGEQNEFDAGLYVVSESNQFGYTASTWGGDCSPGGSITLEVGGVYSCTITNNDEPAKIKVTKIVINDDGGNAEAEDFSLKVNDTSVNSGANNTFNGNVSYTISEVNLPSGYTQTSIVCHDVTGRSPELVANPFVAELGHSYECVITNDDVAPGLTVVKKVINDNGGSAVVADFDIELNDDDITFGTGSVDGSETTYTSNPNIAANTYYTISEADLPGYSEGSWSCTDGSQGNGLNVTVMLEEGEEVTCSITNNDLPAELILVKEVINDNGGNAVAGDFTPTVNGMTSSWGSHVVYAGIYTVSEAMPILDGYSYSGVNCYVTGSPTDVVDQSELLMNGTSRTCVVTNDDIAPKLTLIKHVENDNGGTASATDWTLSAAPLAGNVISGNGDDGVINVEVESNLEYSLNEDGPDGYAVSEDWSCIGGGSFDSNKNTILLNEGDEVTCEITNNDKPPVVFVEKQATPGDTNQQFIFNVTNNNVNYSGNIGLSDGGIYDTGEGLDAGNVTVNEQAVNGWENTFANCFETDLSYGDNQEPIFTDTLPGVGTSFTAENGKTYHCRFENVKNGDVIVTKFHDLNENGYQDEDEPKLEGWEMNLDGDGCNTENLQQISVDIDCSETSTTDKEVTGEDGAATFGNVKPGYYKLYETLQDDWQYSNTYCTYLDRQSYGYIVDDNDYHLYVGAGETIQCYIGNARAPYFLLEKSNNQPNPVPVGTEVLYTLKVTVPEDSGRIYGLGCNPEEDYEEFYLFAVLEEETAEACERPAKVIDLPPKNFTYIPGTWTATSNIRGDLKAQGITGDPAYASPGTWVLTNGASPFLSPGEVITLTYLAKIGNVVPGTYPDLASAVGFSGKGNVVLANISPLNQTNPFVSTSVTVEENQVLGVATLEDTGIDSRLVSIIAASVVILTILLTLMSRRHKGMVIGLVITSALAIAGLGMAPKVEAAQFWTVNMSTPAPITRTGTINVDWQLATALPEVQPGETFTVTLMQNGVATGASQQVTDPNGDSGSFNVTLPAEGTYNLQVKAVSNLDAESKTTSAAAVTFDATPPAAPTVVNKTQNGDTYTITIEIPEGVQPGTLEIYASQNTNFTADNSTLIGTVNYTPGQTVTFSFTKPGSEYFIAVRTVDSNGNTSNFVTENRVRVAAAAAVAAAAVANQGQVGDASATSNEAEVLSDAEDISQEESTEEDSGLNTVWWIVILLTVLGAIGGAIYYNSQRTRD